MSRDVFLSTTGTLATVVIDDLGGVEFVHPVVSLNLVMPSGEFTYDEVINSVETPGAVDSASLQASLNAGHITLTDASGNPITDLVGTTLPYATPTNDGIVSTITQSFGGNKTFNDLVTIGDAGIASPYLLSVQDQDNDGFAYIEILSDRTGSSFGGFNKGAFFGIEDYGNSFTDQWFSLYNWQGGPIVFWTDVTASSGVERFRIENNGVLNVGNTVNYETLIGADDDIPNIKYLNDQIAANPTDLSLGTITTTDVPINSSTGLDIATLPAATGSLAGIVTAEAQTFGGAKTFDGPDDGNIILTAPTPSNSLIIGHDTGGAPNCWGISQTGLGFYFCLGFNSVNPQLMLGNPTGAGIAYIDADFARPIYLNALPTGTGQGVGGRGEVLIGQAGLTVGSLNAGQAPNIRMTTVEGGTDWNIYLGSPGNFDDWLRFSAVGSLDNNEAVLLPDGVWRVKNGASGSPSHGFLNASNYGMYLGGTNDILCFATAGISRLNIASNGVLDVGNTVDYETLIGADDDIPNIAYLNNELAALDWDDLNNVDETGKVTGNLAVWNGTNWVPTEGVNDAIRLLQNGCIAEFIDTTGLDLCITQIGPTAESAFTVGRRALGTIATPTALGDNTKIAGYGAAPYDGTVYAPSAEMSMYSEGATTGTNWGARIEFKVTEENTTTLFNALIIEDDGTLTVRDQTDYELQVTDDDDIPNKKYVDDIPKRSFMFSVARNANNQGNQFLRRQNGTPTNVAPYTVPFDATIHAATAENNPNDIAATWDFVVEVNGVAQVTLSVPGSDHKVTNSSLSVDVSEGDEVTMRMLNQSQTVNHPAGSVFFIER